MPSRRKSVMVRLTVLSPSSVWRWIVPLEHQMPEPSSLALSARNMMICLRAALPKIRSAQRLAIFQLMRGPPERGRRSASRGGGSWRLTGRENRRTIPKAPFRARKWFDNRPLSG
jgi:hypothetical protein